MLIFSYVNVTKGISSAKVIPDVIKMRVICIFTLHFEAALKQPGIQGTETSCEDISLLYQIGKMKHFMLVRSIEY